MNRADDNDFITIDGDFVGHHVNEDHGPMHDLQLTVTFAFTPDGAWTLTVLPVTLERSPQLSLTSDDLGPLPAALKAWLEVATKVPGQ